MSPSPVGTRLSTVPVRFVSRKSPMEPWIQSSSLSRGREVFIGCSPMICPRQRCLRKLNKRIQRTKPITLEECSASLQTDGWNSFAVTSISRFSRRSAPWTERKQSQSTKLRVLSTAQHHPAWLSVTWFSAAAAVSRGAVCRPRVFRGRVVGRQSARRACS